MDRHTEHLPNTPNTLTRVRASHIVTESEKTLEARLRRDVGKKGGMALKLSAQLHRGLPDRLILMPGGRAYFAEIKTTGKKPTKLQEKCHRELRDLGFDVFIVDSTDSLLDALDAIGFDQVVDAVKKKM